MLDDSTEDFAQQSTIPEHMLTKFFFTEIELECYNVFKLFLKEWPDIDSPRHPLIQKLRDSVFQVTELINFTHKELKRIEMAE